MLEIDHVCLEPEALIVECKHGADRKAQAQRFSEVTAQYTRSKKPIGFAHIGNLPDRYSLAQIGIGGNGGLRRNRDPHFDCFRRFGRPTGASRKTKRQNQ